MIYYKMQNVPAHINALQITKGFSLIVLIIRDRIALTYINMWNSKE